MANVGGKQRILLVLRGSEGTLDAALGFPTTRLGVDAGDGKSAAAWPFEMAVRRRTMGAIASGFVARSAM